MRRDDDDEGMELEIDAHRGMAALDLARAHIAQMQIDDPEEAQQIEAVILDAGLLVAELDGPGAWEAFDAAEFAQRTAFLPERERVGNYLHLVGFFGWMSLWGLMEAPYAAAIVRGIARVSPPEPVLEDLCEGLLEQLGGTLH